MKTALLALLCLSTNAWALTIDKKDIVLNVTTGQDATETIVVTNDGTTAVQKLEVDFDYAGGEIMAATFPLSPVSDCPKALAPGASCKVSVTFSPRRRGAYWAVVTVSAKKIDPIYATVEGRTEAVPTASTGLEFSQGEVDIRLQAPLLTEQSFIVIVNRDVIPIDFKRLELLRGFNNFQLNNISCGTSVGVGSRCLVSVSLWAESGAMENELYDVLVAETRDYEYDLRVQGSCFTRPDGRCNF
jgi:hypothetical protein